MKRLTVKVFGLLAVLCLLVSFASVCMAADSSLKRYGVRVRGIYVIPDEKFDGRIPGSETLSIDEYAAPELDLEYFFTKHISTELALAVTKHDIQSNKANIGSTWLLPPSLLVKYHPIPCWQISPYIGFGINVVMPFNERLAGVPDFKVDTSIGYAAQVGADIKLTKNLYWNVDLKYYDCSPDMTINGAKYKLHVNPWLVGTGLGVRF